MMNILFLKRKEWKAIKWLKYGIVSSFVVIILFALILHIVGCHNKKRTIREDYELSDQK